MNVKEIQPIELWTTNGTKLLTHLALSNFFDYHFDNAPGKVTYKLIAMEGDPVMAVEHIADTMAIPNDVLQQWGASDDVIWNYVAGQLGVVII